ncbi:phytanoyl-CoA dioxygenase [Chitinophaga oryziterrae]|uniref:Phytanoyl-CoA dioxygenase n=1 Tax=Chitinophaga oryziterrae TaxID=1031224 RepID=A0A6N8JC52_9BACT|nr:phytanoyl-CoA dioxygenase family protein [Chitinophaga oryziterrae]MVT42028.1 phytanoyl-CoA dioxygenase [Chitinophaga oryziterrae]
MTDFLFVFYATHMGKKQRTAIPVYENFEFTAGIWMNIFGLGKFETYQFLYAECRDVDHFKAWIIDLKGAEFFHHATLQFDNWLTSSSVADTISPVLLSPSQLSFWEQQGYLKISGLVEDTLCDDVKDLICTHLNLSSTWYPAHPDWHGLMLEVYQDARLEAIRKHPQVHQLFAELYNTHHIISNTDKLSFNPPETASWKFKGSNLHWDLDLSKPVEYYIQGLIYLDDVPEDRGPLLVVPGFHHQFADFIRPFSTLDDAMEAVRAVTSPIPVPGVKGDVVVWLNTLPHAASANRSSLPRFVQYLNFSTL